MSNLSLDVNAHRTSAYFSICAIACSVKFQELHLFVFIWVFIWVHFGIIWVNGHSVNGASMGGLTICSAFARMHHDINYHFSPYKKPYELYLIQFCFRFRVQSVSPKCLDRGPVQCYFIEAQGCACTNFYKHPLVRVCSICCRLYTGIYSMCMIYDKSSQSNKAYTCNYLKCLTNWCNLSNYKEIIF